MGALSAMNSINRVLEKHGDQMLQDYAQMVPDCIKAQFRTAGFSNNTYCIAVDWEFQDGSILPGPTISIDELSDLYPDCNVAY